MNEDPTRIVPDEPRNILGNLPPDIPEDPAHYFPWEMYEVGEDVRKLISWIEDPTKRDLAIERIRSLTAAEKERIREVHRDYQLADIKRTITTNSARLERAERRCDGVMSGEKKACRTVAELEATFKQQMLELKLWVIGGLVSRLLLPTAVGILVGIAVAMYKAGH